MQISLAYSCRYIDPSKMKGTIKMLRILELVTEKKKKKNKICFVSQ